MIKIAPSILTCDFMKLEGVIKKLEEAGADYLHLDVMDGVFVPNLTFGAPIVKSIRNVTGLPLDVHLMMDEPANYVEQFAESGADIITVHAESRSAIHLQRVVKKIKACGKRAGVALNPATSHEALEYIYEDCDLILVMTVNPGFGGQKFVPQTLRKIEHVAERISKLGLNIELEVDGGINLENIRQVKDAGAKVIVAGSAVVENADFKTSIEGLKRN